MSGFLGSGDLYYNRVVGGVSQGWLRFGNATKFEIKENTELKERKSKQKATYGQVLDSVAIKQPAEIAVALDDLDKDNLALAFLGDVSAIDVTGAALGAPVGYDTPAFDGIIRVAHEHLSLVEITDGATGAITYVEGVDYEIVSAERGLIKILEGDGTDDIVPSEPYVVDTSGLLIDYTYASATGNKVKGGTNSSIKVALLLDGENFADQSKTSVDVWEAVLAPQTGVDFLSDDFATLELNGTLNTPSAKASAYEINTDLAASA